ncbi:MAG TPA: PD-(D/E)XK nuclease family protein, partial [Kiritimatiellia bacterium]|nr:PD-(D/E)XK nuclease family protein [Kiritimatiellia bacterium]
MSDLLHYLICNEVGTSAFLATLLDPQFNNTEVVQARAALANLLKRYGVEVSSPSPTAVHLEYLNIDLVAEWSPWTLLVENKVASASVTKGQLSSYYRTCLLQIERKEFLSDAPICFIYLTPTPNVGRAEFNSLKLARGKDKMIHIAWSEVLDCITPVVNTNASRTAWFLRAGADRVQEVIAAAKTACLQDDECRSRLQELMNNLKGQFQGSSEFEGLVFRRWSDKVREQLFAAGPGRTAYVGLYLSYNNTEFPTEASIKAAGDITFESASKCRARLRTIVASKNASEWAAILGVSSEQLRIDLTKGSISWRFSLPEMVEEDFIELAKKRLAVFSSVFASPMHETTENGK